MVDWRVETLCRAQHLTDYTFSWDTTYNKVVINKDLDDKTRHDDYTSCSIYDCGTGSECSTYTETILTFISPMKPSYRDVIDGVCDGGLHMTGYLWGQSTCGYMRYYAIVQLVRIRESDGNATVLGSYTTPTEYIAACDEQITRDIFYPFFIDVDNALVDENHRFALRIRTYARKWGNENSIWLRIHHDLNADDTFVNLKYV